MAYSVAEAARTIHAHLCSHNWHGYTQGSTRWGTGRSGYCEVKSQGYTFKVPAGDYDCSSSTITAWQLALEPTKYKGALKGATYTGNMRSVFTKASGLFEWKPISYIAKPGDLYLSEAHHVAMCQVQDGTKDTISEFVINERGTITGGKIGDQTSSESVIRNYRVYKFGWDGILHYTGGADLKDAASAPAPAKKSVTEIAKEVLAGKWGNGDARKKKLEAAGYSYSAVQAEVNKLASAPAKKSVTEIARECINGVWGNGSTRVNKLKAAGYDPVKVQAEVNRLLKK